MIKNLPLALTLLISISACSDTTQTTESTSTAKTSEAKTTEAKIDKPASAESTLNKPETEKEKIIKRLELITKNKNEVLNQKRSISINGEKFITTMWPVVKDATVYNVLMQEQGKIKGSFVVVITTAEQLTAQIKQDYSVKKLAKNTFKLIPKNNNNLDMMQAYKKLMKANFTTLEMEVDYSPIKDQAEF